MHILFLTHHFPTPREAGAPRPWQFARYFSSKGHKVTILAAGYNYMSGERAAQARCFRLWEEEGVGLEGVRCIRTWALTGYKKSILRRIIGYSSFSFLSFVSSLPIRDVDVVLTPNNPPSNSVFGYALAKIKQAKFVEEIREPHPEIDVALGYFKSKPAQQAFKIYHDFFHQRSDLIVSLTPGITRILRDRGVLDSKIVEIPNAYDLENDDLLNQCSQIEVKKRLGWDSKFVILYAGSHGLVPRLQTLLEAAKLLKDKEDILFTLVGEGDHKHRYMEYARRNDLSNCSFLSGQPRDRMPIFYKAADVCTHLIPRGDFWDCILPNKIFDYLGSGTPVIFSGCGDTAELITRACAGIVVEPENPEAFAEAVLDIYHNPKKREQMGRSGRNYVLTHYSREDLMSKLEQALREIL